MIYLIIYLLSIVGCYIGIRRSFTKDFTTQSPELLEVVVVFLPFINTIWTVMFILEGVFKKFPKPKYYVYGVAAKASLKFFRIKR